jgi:hypothetical protein
LLGDHTAALPYDVIEARHGDMKMHGQLVSGHVERLEKFLPEYLARMSGRAMLYSLDL